MRRSHLTPQQRLTDRETLFPSRSSEGFQVMDLRADSFKGMKRMRLDNGEVFDSVCIWDLPAQIQPANELEDECTLGLGVGPPDFNSRSAGSNNETGSGHPLCISQPGSTVSIAVSHGHVFPAHMDAGSRGLAMGLPHKELSGKSWTSADSFCSQESDPNVSPAVELGLGPTIMPTTSGADSVLTSMFPSSIQHVGASSADIFKPDQVSILPSFCQKSSSYVACIADVPMYDEGSTSNGRYMLPFLNSDQVPKTSCLDARRFDLRFNTSQESPVESDASLSFRALSGTTSTSGTSSGSGIGDRAPKLCRFSGCGKRARGASGLCISHGGGRRCQRLGCNKGAEGSTIFCKAHGGGRRCEQLGCTKSAEGKTDFCIAHGGGSRCLSEGCPRAARGRTGYCIRHGGGKRCQKPGCTKSAEGYSALCIAHGGGKRCQYPNCGKGAQGSTMFCKGHGGGKRCTVEGCSKGAEGSTSLCKGHGGGKRCMFDGGGICSKSVHGGTLYCVAHGGGKRCAVEGCTKSARGRTDCCVKHGGGKRCKFENCDKSAQGSTDYCKAHGGGKRCSWGQESFLKNGTDIADLADFCKGVCDKTAKGKLGLCAEHMTLVEDHRVHGIGAFAGSFLDRDEVGRNFLSGFAARDLGQEEYSSRRLKLDSGSHSSEVKGQASQDGLRMPGSASHISQSLYFPPRNTIHANRACNSVVPMRFDMNTSLFKPSPQTRNPTFSQPFGVSSKLWQTIEKGDKCGQTGSSNMEDDEVFNMSSLSLPEERVHGGNIMALLSGGGLK